MRARRISKDRLASVGSEDWVDRTRRPFVEGDIAWVPVKEGHPFDREIAADPLYRGRGFFMAGDIAVVHGERPSPVEVQNIIDLKHPRGIVWQKAIAGITRTPEIEVIWGVSGDVKLRESGFSFILDPAKVMFSPGNRAEKRRIAGLIRAGRGNERVADMFAGIGYFTIPVAAAGARVHAIEINPVACGYLRRNAAENGLADRITAIVGDCRTNLDGTFDRILMGHFDAIAMLPHALRHAGAGTVIHLHSIGSCEEEIAKTVRCAGFSCGIEVHKVKKFRPRAWHVVHDITIA